MSEPDHEFLKRGEVMAWLTSTGLSERTVRTLIDGGHIKGAPLPGGTYDYYRRSQIKNDILQENGAAGK
jgi:hypothetical protein